MSGKRSIGAFIKSPQKSGYMNRRPTVLEAAGHGVLAFAPPALCESHQGGLARHREAVGWGSVAVVAVG